MRLFLFCVSVFAQVTIDAPKAVLIGFPFSVKVSLKSESTLIDTNTNAFISAKINDVIVEGATGTLSQGSVGTFEVGNLVVNGWGYQSISLEWKSNGETVTESFTVNAYPGYLSVVPVALVLVLALVTKQVLLSLFFGVFLSATLIYGFNPLVGLLRALDTYIIAAVSDKDHIKIMFLSMFLAGMVALIQRSGGANGLARAVSKFARNRYGGQWMSWVLGCIIFIDDYASCLIVGTNMRPITDLLYISREKLAFIVHATSAPPASLAPLSSWIGFELGLIGAELTKLKIETDPLVIFFETFPSRFYPIFMLLFMPIGFILKKDFGPMLKAERRAHKFQKVVGDDDLQAAVKAEIEPIEGKPHRWINAVLPIVVTIIVSIVGLFVSGYYEVLDIQKQGEAIEMSISNMAGKGSSYDALIWASFSGSIVSMILIQVQSLFSFRETIDVWIDGIKSLIDALLTLFLAWSIGNVMNDLKVTDFFVSGLSGSMPPAVLPALVFILSCVISFCTGTSWGTMAIMYPLAVPIAGSLPLSPEDLHFSVVSVISSILAGSIFGDQCSPISDTSVLSAMASGVSVHAHVITQLPYAVISALTAVAVGYLPFAAKIYPSWVGILLGIVVLSTIVFVFGENVENDEPSLFAKYFGCCRRKNVFEGEEEEKEQV